MAPEAQITTRSQATGAKQTSTVGPYYALFFISGFPALLYQIVWQRALFTIYGVNIQSVTVIVTVFMLGLGIGSLAGGKLSARPGLRLLRAFGFIELGIGAFGIVSLAIFHWAAAFTAGASSLAIGFITFGLLFIPTLLMGSTLPLLVAQFVRRNSNVGESVASLYSVNTLGSGTACFAAALFLMRMLGESGCITLAASLNLLVGATALFLQYRHQGDGGLFTPMGQSTELEPRRTIPFWMGMALAAAVGFISLAYEIVWYRLYSFTSGGAAPSFAKLLAFYLFGIGYGSLAVRDICRNKLRNDLPRTLQAASSVVILGSIVGFALGPALAFSVRYVPYDLTFPFVFVGAALLGAAFPILSQAAIDPRQAVGSRISYLYLSNIVGSALGSFLVGFVFLDHWTIQTVSFVLLVLGLSAAVLLAKLSGRKPFRAVLVSGLSAAAVLTLFASPLFENLYARLLFKKGYTAASHFQDVIENRSGVITVTHNGTVFGGGVYDGQFNTDLMHDSNGIFRAYAVAGLHPSPKQVLVIGLSSGSWAKVIANHPDVEHVTIVEINPGYLPLIRKQPKVSSLLQNPKVDVVIDDGRRWLMRHKDRKFDFILMNTSFHWRAHTSNLLSTEFLRLIRSHLNPGGIEYYNTTWSGAALATGAAEFPYALRIANFLAVSDSQITLDKTRWKSALLRYRIDGQPIFDPANAGNRSRLATVLNISDNLQAQAGLEGFSTESRNSLLRRLKGARVITDDNMGTEWSESQQ